MSGENHLFVLYHLTVLAYTKTAIYLSLVVSGGHLPGRFMVVIDS